MLILKHRNITLALFINISILWMFTQDFSRSTKLATTLTESRDACKTERAGWQPDIWTSVIHASSVTSVVSVKLQTCKNSLGKRTCPWLGILQRRTPSTQQYTIQNLDPRMEGTEENRSFLVWEHSYKALLESTIRVNIQY